MFPRLGSIQFHVMVPLQYYLADQKAMIAICGVIKMHCLLELLYQRRMTANSWKVCLSSYTQTLHCLPRKSLDPTNSSWAQRELPFPFWGYYLCLEINCVSLWYERAGVETSSCILACLSQRRLVSRRHRGGTEATATVPWQAELKEGFNLLQTQF